MESIVVDESLGQSNSTQKPKRSSKLAESSGRLSKSNKLSDKIEEQDENSLSRGEEEIEEEDYTQSFASEGTNSASLLSSKKTQKTAEALKKKADQMAESGYTDDFEEASIGQSGKGRALVQSSQNNEIEIVNEEDDQESSEKPSATESVKESKRSQRRSPEGSQRVDQSTSELEDKEVFETTSSVQWEVVL